ncbi:hypothetical protein [Nonlabens sp.]|uniref:hypothetical protein n=1 Tax=Nonlabens sp. TaxID=1888209 RepID=UPI0032642547
MNQTICFLSPSSLLINFTFEEKTAVNKEEIMMDHNMLRLNRYKQTISDTV